nr:hypothetical protein [Kibdelosporangium sp. MJ126-NF4]CTQ96669.1 hypothetical protein [Kibdelosporangium sp. MJ126-NF4]
MIADSETSQVSDHDAASAASPVRPGNAWSDRFERVQPDCVTHSGTHPEG